jgi:hypothetical protein
VDLEKRSGLTVRESEVVSNSSDRASVEIVAIHLVAQARGWTEVLEEAIKCIGEVQFAVLGVNDQVIEGVELTSEVVVQECYMVSVTRRNS